MATKTRLQLLLTAATATALALAPTAPAAAEPFAHETFHEEFDSTNDCGEGLVLEFHDVQDGRVVVVRHGDGFLYETLHWTLTAAAEIPGTDLSLTVVNQGLVGHDVQVTHNGDGTLTVKRISPARATVLVDGRPESHFSGLYTFEQLWDDAGTPEDQTDDVLLASDLNSTLHGHFDGAGVCEVAQRYAP